MRDVLWPGTILGYCTNVHAGTTLDEVKANLERHALAVKAKVSPNAPMGIGLWLAADVARELIDQDRVEDLRDWLGERGLEVFTMNGFPYGNFHEPVVKHKVYRPDWSTSERLSYTLDLADILQMLLPADEEGSISTLPIGWGSVSGSRNEQARRQLVAASRALGKMESDSGALIHLDIEPEPGCAIGDLASAERWYQNLLMLEAGIGETRRYLRLCLDICHAAVMFDDIPGVVRRMDEQGIRIGKVQVSNALRLDLSRLSDRERADAIAQVRQFAEDRYLHQTMVREDEQRRLFEDLPDALRHCEQGDRAGDEWRIHYHMPLFLRQFGLISTMQDRIIECLKLLRDRDVSHWEIETYAWNVLPKELQHETLADGIAQEFRWMIEQAEKLR